MFGKKNNRNNTTRKPQIDASELLGQEEEVSPSGNEVPEVIEEPSGEGYEVAPAEETSEISVSEEAVIEEIRPLTKYLRLKNKTVSADNVELILEYKAGDDKALEKALSGRNGISRFAFMNYDRETRI